MNLLFIGDVVGRPGCEALQRTLPALKRRYGADVTVVNGENSAVGNGILPHSANWLFDSGADVITGGNHSFKRPEICSFIDDTPQLLRPANLPHCPYGNGVFVVDKGAYRVAVVSLIGTVYMDWAQSPFDVMDEILETLDTPNIFVDFHAESTGEKKALAYYLSGKVSAVLGTHTHVQTADACVLDGAHTAFLSDVGMTGPSEAVLGVKRECIIRKMRTHMPVRFETAGYPCRVDFAVVSIDERTGRCSAIETGSMSVATGS